MPDISELVGLGKNVSEDKWYVEDRPFAAAGHLQLWNVRQTSNFTQDQVVAIALVDQRRCRGALLESRDIPGLYDLLRGIVERNKLF